MQISASSTAYGASQAQRALSALLQQKTEGTGQDMPGAGRASASGGPPTGAPPGPPPSGPSSQFAFRTLADLLGVQEAAHAPVASDRADDLLGQADSDGDGALSLEEVKNALGTDASSAADGLAAAVSNLDADGDGELSADELTAGFERARPPQHDRQAHGARGGPSGGDVAAQLIKDADGDQDGALNSEEIASALGQDAGDLTSSIGKLDSDGDGKLSAAELSAALDAFRSTDGRGQAEGGQPAAQAPAIA